MADSETTKQTLVIRDWSYLPEELLLIISTLLNNCFEVIHVRSVCRMWRSSIPLPSCLLRTSYAVPSFSDFPFQNTDLCIFEKVPLFLFRVRATIATAQTYCEFFLGDINQDDSADHVKLPSPLLCTVKVKIPGSDPTVRNMLDCQILSLGHQYRMIGWDLEPHTSAYEGVAILPLDKGREGEFVVLVNYTNCLLVLTSAEMIWKRLQNFPTGLCSDLCSFRGRFYVAYDDEEMFVIDPYSLKVTPLMPLLPLMNTMEYLVPCGDDELFLVQQIFPCQPVIDLFWLACRVSRLDEEAGEWVEVTDLRDHVMCIGELGRVSCSAKELPDGCGNSIVFTNGEGNVTYAYKYGVRTGNAEEEELGPWRFSRRNRVMILNRTPPLVALLVKF